MADATPLARNFGAVEIRANTFREEGRTVEIIWAAGALVHRREWDGDYIEELSMDPAHIRMDRFKAGMSLLDSHDATNMETPKRRPWRS